MYSYNNKQAKETSATEAPKKHATKPIPASNVTKDQEHIMSLKPL
jgi:hypothetical protein